MLKSTEIDALDAAIIERLQADGRMSATALARAIGLSVPAVTERLRRLNDSSIIVGYSARIASRRLGYELKAFVRLKHTGANYKPFRRLLEERHEIIECDHVTGDDCFIMKVLARSMEHLEELTRDIARFGDVTTSVVYSTFLEQRAVKAVFESTGKALRAVRLP